MGKFWARMSLSHTCTIFRLKCLIFCIWPSIYLCNNALLFFFCQFAFCFREKPNQYIKESLNGVQCNTYTKFHGKWYISIYSSIGKEFGCWDVGWFNAALAFFLHLTTRLDGFSFFLSNYWLCFVQNPKGL